MLRVDLRRIYYCKYTEFTTIIILGEYRYKVEIVSPILIKVYFFKRFMQCLYQFSAFSEVVGYCFIKSSIHLPIAVCTIFR